MSRLCRWPNPTWIDAYAAGCISESCRLLQSAEGEMTHHTNGNNRDARSKKGVLPLPPARFRSSSLVSPLNCPLSAKATKAWGCGCGFALSTLM
jgi:hypothetical protein